jgi:hypothetical protein
MGQEWHLPPFTFDRWAVLPVIPGQIFATPGPPACKLGAASTSDVVEHLRDASGGLRRADSMLILLGVMLGVSSVLLSQPVVMTRAMGCVALPGTPWSRCSYSCLTAPGGLEIWLLWRTFALPEPS